MKPSEHTLWLPGAAALVPPQPHGRLGQRPARDPGAHVPAVDPARLMRDVAAVHDESQVEHLLPALAGIGGVGGAIGIAALVRRLPLLPQRQRAGAFARLMEAAWGVQAEQRWRVLQSMARRLHALPAEAMDKGFFQLLEAAMALPPDHAPDTLEALVGRLGLLPEGDRLACFRRIVDELPHVLRARRGRVVWCMARELATLAALERETALGWLLWNTTRLEPSLRGVPLVGLCWALHDLNPEARWSLFQQLLQGVGQLPGPVARAPLAELAAALYGLLPEQRATAFSALAAAVQALPAGERWEPASRLARVLGAIDEPAPAFRALIDMGAQLPAPGQCHVLEALAFAVEFLPSNERAGAFNAVLAAVRALPPALQSAPLQALADHALETLPTALRPTARNELFGPGETDTETDPDLLLP